MEKVSFKISFDVWFYHRVCLLWSSIFAFLQDATSVYTTIQIMHKNLSTRSYIQRPSVIQNFQSYQQAAIITSSEIVHNFHPTINQKLWHCLRLWYLLQLRYGGFQKRLTGSVWFHDIWKPVRWFLPLEQNSTTALLLRVTNVSGGWLPQNGP